MLPTNMAWTMSKQLNCPMEGCHASIEADSEDEVMAQAQAHAESAHPELELDEETVASIKAQIKDV